MRLVNADALLSELEKYNDLSAREKNEYLFGMQQRLETCIELVEDAPTVDAVPVRHGRWTIEDCHAVTYRYCCSNCTAHHRARYAYCPSCGAVMDGKELFGNSEQLEKDHFADPGKMVGDLISRAAAIDALEKVAELFPWKVPGNRDSYDRYNEAWNDAIGRAEMEIENMPPAQPEIIRCRNCKFASGDSRICMKFGHSPIGELDFCAWAERRTDEE